MCARFYDGLSGGGGDGPVLAGAQALCISDLVLAISRTSLMCPCDAQDEAQQRRTDTNLWYMYRVRSV